MPDMDEIDTIISRLLWSEMKDPAEFRSYLARAGYKIIPLTPTPAMCEAGWAQVTIASKEDAMRKCKALSKQ